MRTVLSTLLPIALAERGQNGWKINCQVTTGDVGPAFTAVTDNSDGSHNIEWSYFSLSHAGVRSAGPFEDFGGDHYCESADNSTNQVVVDGLFDWPNNINPVPAGTFGKSQPSNLFIAADGFATPIARDGCLAIFDITGDSIDQDAMFFVSKCCGQQGALTTKWYYHVTKFIDMDKDGDLDIVTARSSGATNPLDPKDTQLLWFENPGKSYNVGNRNWNEHVISVGNNIADVSVDVTTIKNQIYILAGGFASRQLIVVTSSDWTDDSKATAYSIDTDGYYFDAIWADLDMDGTPDAAVTIGSYGEKPGQLVVYQGSSSVDSIISSDSKTVVYDQFEQFEGSNSLGSPGSVSVFQYSTSGDSDGDIPSLLISGDDDGYMYMADPTSTKNFNFEYDLSTIFVQTLVPIYTPLTAPTIGQQSVVDINGDGCNEIIVPGYHAKSIYILEQMNTRNCKV
jgi:hypothetical protein